MGKEKREFSYLIVRWGSNSANQPMTERKPIAFVKASSQEEAIRKAFRNEVEFSKEISCVDGTPCILVYANQNLEAIPQSRVKESDWRWLYGY